MAAKLLLHSLADENPDLQKQIGCMTGIFQLFDRQHVISGRRIIPKRFPPPPPPGSTEFNNNTHDQEFNSVYRRQTADEMNFYKSQIEKQRVSTESSRASFSSSCSSSLSSLECSRTTQQDVSSFDRMIFPETPSRDPTINQSSTSRQSVDLKDVVKDSMYREIRSLSVKPASNEDSLPVKNRDSPRPVDLKESLRVLAKLREAPWEYNNEYEHKDIGSVPREGRRFSYDGREREGNRFSSFESRETIKSTPKLRELPRLSLDGRQSSILDSRSNLKATHFVNDDGSRLSNVNFDDKVRLSQKKPPSVVAKLMGLEALPDSASDADSCSVPLKRNEPMLPIRGFKSGMKEPTSPRWRNADGTMKPVLKIPNEPAPWKQMDGNRGLQNRATAKPLKVPLKTVNASVYGEIEKRLKDLEFKQSGKDLRALKQILEAIQSKGLLETRKEEQPTNFAAHKNPRLDSQQNVESSSRFESPIVIMKPAKLVERQGLRSSSVVAIDSLSNLQKLQVSGGRGKIQSPRSNNHQTDNKKSSGRGSTRSAVTQSSAKSQTSSSSVKNAGSSVSPRLQQRKLELEKRSRPPTPPSDPSKPRRQLGRHQTAESSSPGGRSRPKLPNSRPSDDQLSEASNESKAPSLQGDDSDSNNIPDLKMDEDLKNSEQPSQKSTLRLGEDEPISELASIGGAAEHHSPISVLDVSEYTDDASSPVKQEPTSLKDEIERGSTYDHVGENWSVPQTSAAMTPLPSEINHKKLQNIDQLVKKLTRLNSTHNEESTDYIASLCENDTNPDHRYISEILLASGLLLRDLTCTSMPFQLHPSGHPINPELFCVLEQTKAWSKPKTEKIQRRLIFDAVNEILVGKLTSAGIIAEPRVRPERVAKQTITAQKLLKELCFEIQQLEAKKKQQANEVAAEEEDDSLKVVLWEDVMNRSEKWTDFHADTSGIVLDIERLIFKDLVNEVLRGGVRARPPSRRRQLFAK